MNQSTSAARELEQLVRKATREAIQRAQEEDPRFKSLSVSHDVRAYRKRPKGWSKHQERVVEGFLTVTSMLHETNKQTVERLATWFPDYQVPEGVMYRRLQPKSRSAIEGMLRKHGLAIELCEDESLSTLRRAIKAGVRSTGEPDRLKAEVEIGQDYVTSNGKPHKIEHHRASPSVRVTANGKRGYIRVDLLAALLES